MRLPLSLIWARICDGIASAEIGGNTGSSYVFFLSSRSLASICASGKVDGSFVGCSHLRELTDVR